jgi:hypothetical protein
MKNKLLLVFDLDETIGYFSQLKIIWNIIIKIKDSFDECLNEQHIFNAILNDLNELLRPNIINILKYLTYNKNNNFEIIMFTNNQGGKNWISLINNYLESNVNKKIFDKIIYPNKIKTDVIEDIRKKNHKNYDDLIKCSGSEKNTKVCFIDDKTHLQMINENVHFIKIDPYVKKIQWAILIERINNLKIINYNLEPFLNILEYKIPLKYNNYVYTNDNIFDKIIYFLKKNIINKTFKKKYFNSRTLKINIQ